jgi:hypothetical protein
MIKTKPYSSVRVVAAYFFFGGVAFFVLAAILGKDHIHSAYFLWVAVVFFLSSGALMYYVILEKHCGQCSDTQPWPQPGDKLTVAGVQGIVVHVDYTAEKKREPAVG